MWLNFLMIGVIGMISGWWDGTKKWFNDTLWQPAAEYFTIGEGENLLTALWEFIVGVGILAAIVWYLLFVWLDDIN